MEKGDAVRLLRGRLLWGAADKEILPVMLKSSLRDITTVSADTVGHAAKEVVVGCVAIR